MDLHTNLNLNLNLPHLARTLGALLHQNRTLLATSAAALAVGLPVLARVRADYRAWHALGENGLPLNPFGYAFQALASPFARRDQRAPAPYDLAALAASPRYGAITLRSFLRLPNGGELPARAGPRPEVPAFVGPHRQTSQASGAAVRAQQSAFLSALARANPALLQLKPSNLEGPRYDGLYVHGSMPRRPEFRFLNGEFAHAHGEGSTHVVLSLADAEAAIARGWAERHRMSGVGRLMPWSFVLVYGPRDEAELALWKEFVLASARYALGEEGEVAVP
ncbi:hypothetical protein F4819DRAFT_229594 [Hypoxylon fuscum]|nr:hypothetical protein F4819DRAFT_229594 [Hypoxylon fuscum]